MTENSNDSSIDIKDNNNNDIFTEEEIMDIEKTILITENMSDVNTSNVYKIKGSIIFDVIIDMEKDAQKEIRGKIRSDILLGDTKIYQIETWRFCLNNLSISNIHCDSCTDELEYSFTAKSFTMKA